MTFIFDIKITVMKNLMRKSIEIVFMIQKKLHTNVTGVLLTGAIIVFTTLNSKGQSGIPIIATENHVGLAVKNLDTQKKWYEKVFGMKEEQHFESSEYKVRTVLLRSTTGLGMELIEVKEASRKRDYKNALDAASDLGYGHWAIVVKDVKQAYSLLITAGATSVSAPAPAVQPGASFAYVKDPEGNLIELMQLASKK